MVEKQGLPVVPAAPGWIALWYRRTTTGIEIERAPVLAWRVVPKFWNSWADPVTTSATAGCGADDEPCFKAPDGIVWSTGLQSWPDEGAWAQAMRGQADADDAAAKGEPLRP